MVQLKSTETGRSLSAADEAPHFPFNSNSYIDANNCTFKIEAEYVEGSGNCIQFSSMGARSSGRPKYYRIKHVATNMYLAARPRENFSASDKVVSTRHAPQFMSDASAVSAPAEQKEVFETYLASDYIVEKDGRRTYNKDCLWGE